MVETPLMVTSQKYLSRESKTGMSFSTCFKGNKSIQHTWNRNKSSSGSKPACLFFPKRRQKGPPWSRNLLNRVRNLVSRAMASLEPLHLPKLTWNLTRSPIKRAVVYQGPLLRFHVSFGECSVLPAQSVEFRRAHHSCCSLLPAFRCRGTSLKASGLCCMVPQKRTSDLWSLRS